MRKSYKSIIVIIVTVFLCGLAAMCFIPKNNKAATQSQAERVSPSEINRKTPNALRRKMLEATTMGAASPCSAPRYSD